MAGTKHGERDRLYKRFYSDAAVVEDIVREFVNAAWVEELDFSTLRKLSVEVVAPGHGTTRRTDMAWQVKFRDRPLHLALLFEFQSTVDHGMPARVLVETALFYEELAKSAKKERDGATHVVLPIVVKSAEGKWTAPLGVAEMLVGLVPEELMEYAFGQRYLLLDEAAEAKKARNLSGASGLVRAGLALRYEDDPERLERAVAVLDELLGEQSVARREYVAWLQSQAIDSGMSAELVERMNTLKEAGAMYANRWEQRKQEWLGQGRTEGQREGEARGRREGEARGQREGEARGRREGEARAQVEMARLKFGDETADRLARVLRGKSGPKRAAEMARLLLECETGEELVAKIDRD